MTTTLVLTPEREAHISYLMEQEIQIKVDNEFDDDGILISATISLWDAMTADEQEVFIGAKHSIEYVGIGQCTGWMGCSSIKHIYKKTIHEGDDSFLSNSNICASCYANATFRYNFTGLKHTAYEVYDHQLSLMLAIENIFPPATQETTSCERCNYFLAPEGLEVDRWYQTTDAHTSADTIIQVHHRCAYVCKGCNERWSYSIYNYEIDGDNYCQPCFDRYEQAGDVTECDYGTHYTFDSELRYSEVRNEDMCRQCYDNYIECGDCGYEYAEDDGHTCEDDEESSNYSQYIHSYGYRPRPIFYPNAFEPYYLGIELEVEVCGDHSRNDCAETVINALNHRVYLKEDGSLSDGFEIVTHPHTLFAYQNDIDWDFLKQLSKLGVRSWNRNSCGLHVHVSRTAFYGESYAANEAHLVRFNKLIYDNQRQVERLAGRKNNHYASFEDKGKVIRKVKFGNQSSGRYSAVNMEPENTIEVRVFKGSLRKERVLSGVEFVAAAVEYTRNLKIQHKSAPFAWARFVHYVTANSDTYPNLFTIMNETFEKDNDPNGDN